MYQYRMNLLNEIKNYALRGLKNGSASCIFYITDVLGCLYNTFKGSIPYPNTCVCG